MRRGLIGVAMGLTAIALIYSPWGKRSGAHMNPSVTLTFWRLGKIKSIDALFYIVFQFLGGWVGVALVRGARSRMDGGSVGDVCGDRARSARRGRRGVGGVCHFIWADGHGSCIV